MKITKEHIASWLEKEQGKDGDLDISVGIYTVIIVGVIDMEDLAEYLNYIAEEE